MVQILENNPSFGQQIGRALGEQGGKFASNFAEDLALKKRGIDVSGLTGYARDVAIKEGMKRSALIEQGRRTLEPQGGQTGIAPTQGAQPAIGARAQEQTLPPSRQTAGQRPQGGTSKIIIPPEQIESVASQRAHAKLNRGLPTDLQTEIGLIQQENANVSQYQGYQKQIGEQAATELEKVYKRATPEELAYFRRKGETLATQGLSQAQIDRELARESRNFTNQLKKLDETQGARARHKIGQFLKGTSRTSEQRRKEIQTAAKPLLDAGLYESVRNRLHSNGYGPEETEALISDLGEQSKKSLSDFNAPIAPKGDIYKYKYKGGKKEAVSPTEDPTYRTYAANPQGQQEFSQNLQKTLQSDPNANLLLLRKAYEDKGVDWNTFKQEFDSLLESGQIQLNDDQMNMSEYLQEPPLHRLDKILSEFNFIGR